MNACLMMLIGTFTTGCPPATVTKQPPTMTMLRVRPGALGEITVSKDQRRMMGDKSRVEGTASGSASALP